jgi:hypothetical protein
MKKRKKNTSSLLGKLLVVGFAALVEKISTTETKPQKAGNEEKSIERKVTMAHIIYHAIGIFYNE